MLQLLDVIIFFSDAERLYMGSLKYIISITVLYLSVSFSDQTMLFSIVDFFFFYYFFKILYFSNSLIKESKEEKQKSQ